MAQQTQEQIDALIQYIEEAEDPESISNEAVATVLDFFNEKLKSGDLSIEELSASLNALQAALSGLQTELNGKASLDSDTGKLDHSLAPTMLFDSMGYDLNNVNNPPSPIQYLPQAGHTVFDLSTGKIVYYKTSSSTVTRDPDTRLIYGNKLTGFLYQWRGSEMRQVGGGPGSVITIVNDLVTGGIKKGLSAEMGKRLKAKIEEVQANIQRLYNNLGNIAFWDAAAKAAAAPVAIDWGNPKHTVTLDLDLTNAVAKHDGVTKSDGDTILVEEGSTLNIIVEPDSGYMLTDNDVSSSTAGANVTPLGNGTYNVAIVMRQSNLTLNIEATADVVPQVSVTKNLTGVEVDSETQNVAYNQPYELTIKRHKYYFPLGTYPNDETLTVTMGGTDITSSAWDASTGKISIAHVTGVVVITMTAVSYIKYNYYLAENDGSDNPETGYAITDCYIKIPSNLSDYTFFLKPGLNANDNKCGVLEYTSSFVRNENWTQKYLGTDSSITHTPKTSSVYLRLSMFMDGGTIKSGAYLKMNSKATTLFDTDDGLQGCTVYYNGVETTFPAISQS